MINNNLKLNGIDLDRAGIHTRRTIMFDDLEKLLEYSDLENISKEKYQEYIVDQNCLSKKSQKTRELSYQYLCDTYLLDKNILLFKALHYFWKRDEKSHSQLAFLCAYHRDALLRLVTPFILNLNENTLYNKLDLEAFIEEKQPGRFSQRTLESTVRNLSSSFSQSGHLDGRVKKTKIKLEPTVSSVGYALFISYLHGYKGEQLFKNDIFKLLECTYEHAIELASEASMKGWFIFKRLGSVIEVTFPSIVDNKTLEGNIE